MSTEKKQLYTSSTKPYTPKGIMNNKKPEFFSYFLNTLMKIYNFIIFIYIIMSLVLFFMFQVYDKNINNKKNTNEKIAMDSNTTKLNDFFTKETSETISLFENEAFTSITLIATYLSVLIVINNFSTSKKSPLFFGIFYVMSIFITINFLTNFLEAIPFFKNLTDPFKTNNDIISKTFLIFQYIFSAMNSLLLIYFVYIYFAQIGYFKYNLETLSFEQIYREIALRTDMMKISFNFWIISMKLNKLFPGLLYRKKDYYFNKIDLPDDMEEFEDELNDKVDSLKSMPNNMTMYSNCKRGSANYSSDAIHSHSTIDYEYESFKQ